jgi:hypothetical protein
MYRVSSARPAIAGLDALIAQKPVLIGGKQLVWPYCAPAQQYERFMSYGFTSIRWTDRLGANNHAEKCSTIIMPVIEDLMTTPPADIMPVMQVIEAQCATILVPHDHLHNNHERAFRSGTSVSVSVLTARLAALVYLMRLRND